MTLQIRCFWVSSNQSNESSLSDVAAAGEESAGAVMPSRDSLLKSVHKTYGNFLDELSADDVFEGLLGFGLFGDRLPPALTSESFLEYCNENTCNPGRSWHEWVEYRYLRNINQFRDYGIPNPFAYLELVRHICDHWKEMVALLKTNTAGQPYCVSRIHIRKTRDSKALFSMGYKNWKTDCNPLPALLVGRRYLVHCDISKCFPSIYTHALDWAVVGREEAKRNHSGHIDTWSKELDHLTSCCTNGETHGLLIGPHASNLLAELILTEVDKELIGQGYRFIRNIDDYECYVDSADEAERFVIELEGCLAQYRLTLNQKKTEIRELPGALTDSWVRLLRSYPLSEDEVSYSEAASYLDYAIDRMGKADGNASVLLYAFKVLAGKRLKYSAKRYYEDMACHLAHLYPYLVPHLEEYVFEPCATDAKKIALVSAYLYRKSLNTRDYLTTSYCFYFATKYSFELPDVQASEVIDTDDCVLKFFAFVYAGKRDKGLRDVLRGDARRLAAIESDFEKNWLFAYHALPLEDLPEGPWRAIKRKGVKFFDPTAFEASASEEPSQSEMSEEHSDQASDDHGESFPTEQGVNEL